MVTIKSWWLLGFDESRALDKLMGEVVYFDIGWQSRDAWRQCDLIYLWYDVLISLIMTHFDLLLIVNKLSALQRENISSFLVCIF